MMSARLPKLFSGRDFKKHGIIVVELKRTKMGNLPLDKTLKSGESRYIDENEVRSIVAK